MLESRYFRDISNTDAFEVTSDISGILKALLLDHILFLMSSSQFKANLYIINRRFVSFSFSFLTSIYIKHYFKIIEL